jgi:hypothetical protein
LTSRATRTTIVDRLGQGIDILPGIEVEIDIPIPITT